MVFKERVDSYVLDSCATTSQSFSVRCVTLCIKSQISVSVIDFFVNVLKKKLANQGLACEHIIITGVDSHMFNPRKRQPELRMELMFGDPNGFLCVYCGRISREKQLDLMVTAVKAIPNAYLAIIGDGPMASYFAEMHGPENRIYCKPRFLDHFVLAEVRTAYPDHQLHSLTALDFCCCSVLRI